MHMCVAVCAHVGLCAHACGCACVCRGVCVSCGVGLLVDGLSILGSTEGHSKLRDDRAVPCSSSSRTPAQTELKSESASEYRGKRGLGQSESPPNPVTCSSSGERPLSHRRHPSPPARVTPVTRTATAVETHLLRPEQLFQQTQRLPEESGSLRVPRRWRGSHNRLVHEQCATLKD